MEYSGLDLDFGKASLCIYTQLTVVCELRAGQSVMETTLETVIVECWQS